MVAVGRQAPQEQYALPPDLGGLRTVYPLVDNATPALMTEVTTDWGQTIAGGENVCWPRFDGDVWSIQLTARPGYYVAPEIQESLGWDLGEVPDDA